MSAEIRLNEGPQTVAYESIATEILFGGAAGGSKSFLLRTVGLACCLGVPRVQVYLFRRTYPQLIKNHLAGNMNILEMAHPWTKSGFATWNWSRKALEFKNGANFFFNHCQHEPDVYDYHGAEIHVLLMDELTTFTAFIYRYLRGRMRAPGLVVPPGIHWSFPKVISGTNPGNVGHNWVKEAFITPAAPYEIWQTPNSEGGLQRQYIPAKLDDNKSMSVEEREDYKLRLEGLGNPGLVKAMLEGSWDIVAGGMFDDVWDYEHNTCAPFDIPPGWPITRSFDWGSSKPFSVGWWTESNGEEVTLREIDPETGQHLKRTWPRGHRFRIAEWYGWNSKENGGHHDTGEPNVGCKMLAVDIARGIVAKEKAWGLWGRVQPGAADSSIYDTDRGKSIAQEMEEEGIFWERADKGPGSRVNGWELMRKMLKASHQQPQESPGLTVFRTGYHFIRCIPVLPRDMVKTDDVDSAAEDHNADESRYELSRVSGTAARVPMTGN